MGISDFCWYNKMSERFMKERNLCGLIVLEAGKPMKMVVAFNEDFILLCVMTEGWKGK